MDRQIDFDGSMNQALAAYREAAAVACVDARTGMLLGASTRGANFEDVLEHAAIGVSSLCTAPSSRGDDESDDVDETLVISDAWTHAFARVRDRPDLIVVGMAPGSTNVALLRKWVREVADRVGASTR